MHQRHSMHRTRRAMRPLDDLPLSRAENRCHKPLFLPSDLSFLKTPSKGLGPVLSGFMSAKQGRGVAAVADLRGSTASRRGKGVMVVH
jgi:hypothetical protein